jgi:hypothetical protein
MGKDLGTEAKKREKREKRGRKKEQNWCERKYTELRHYYFQMSFSLSFIL